MSINSKYPHPVSTSQPLLQSNYSPKSRVFKYCPQEHSVTKQEFKDECDINVLMSRYMATGELPNLNEREPQYLDATGFDYQEQMNFVAGAQTLFNELPSRIRNRFDNDPGLFLDFCSNENNRSEMAEMGLLKPQSEWTVPVAAAVAAVSTEPPVTDQSI